MEWNLSNIVNDILVEYLKNPLSYSLGAVFLGLLAHKIVSWLFANPDETEIELNNPEDGLLSDMVLPMRCLKWRRINLSGKWHTNIAGIVNPPSGSHWKPVLVFANRKSGSNQGADILDQCRRLLNPVQVHDLSSRPPNATLELCSLLPETTFTILVCGGDGSVNWVLSTIDSLQMQVPPHVAVLPLGTGNDLANVLGWGTSFEASDTVESYLTHLRYAQPLCVDRWSITVDHDHTYLRWRRQSQKKYHMTNYFSIGCDALLALKFHKQRQKKPALFTSRSINKLFYFGYGAIDVLEQHCKDLSSHMELWLDAEKVDLPDLEGILFLNISTWGGGCHVWDNMADGDIQWQRSDPGDGLIEVMAFTSSFHMGQIQMNLAEPIRLGQAKTARLKVNTRIPAQVDGEPWELDPCDITVKLGNQATLLMKEVYESSDESEILQLETS